MNNNIKVLICNDIADDGIQVANKLRTYGFYAYTRHKDGKVILESIASDNPDVVVMDFNIPHIDSLSLIRRVKRTGLNSPVFIVTSQYENPYAEKRLIDSGASYFLLKPFDCEGLCEIINGIIQDNEYCNCETLETVVTEIIHRIGIPTKIKGFSYLRSAVIASYNNSILLNNVTTMLYPKIAGIYNTTGICVERNIRNAIDSAWKNGNPATLNEMLGYNFKSDKKRPTNSELISLITESLLVKYKYSLMEM
ncbi:MAG: sporulation initiation factor Spo0A C-terminal domain-containing protein [Ruminococcus sp.]